MTPPLRARLLVTASLCLGLLTGLTPTAALAVNQQRVSATGVTTTGPDGERLALERTADLTALAASVRSCTTGPSPANAGSPLFNSCYDWHSSVHAYWALHATSAMTLDPSWSDYASTRLPASRVPAERSYMASKIVGNVYENPYGLAWMLRLVREREELTGDTSLRPLADYAASSMQSRMSGWSTYLWTTGVTNTEYGNASWALLNLKEWADHTGNASLATWTSSKASQWLMSSAADSSCPLSRDRSTTASGFFAPCLLRLSAVVRIKGDAAVSWANARVPVGYAVPPRPNSGTAHSNALNFARAYALGRLGAQLARPELTENAAALINWQIDRPAVWTVGGDYVNTHWIPQIGVLAIQATP